MDLIEIVELRNANSRTNGFSEHKGERTIYYSTVYSSYTIVMIYLKWQSKYTKTTNDILCQRYDNILVFHILEYS